MPRWQAALLGLTIGFVLGIIMCGSAYAQRACLPHDEATKRLQSMHDEHLIGKGLSRSGLGVELFVSPTGTWTMVTTDTRGLSCVRASGTFWGVVEPKPDGIDT